MILSVRIYMGVIDYTVYFSKNVAGKIFLHYTVGCGILFNKEEGLL